MSDMIEINKLKEHPRNREFFDDIYGDRWEDFKQSVVRRGVVEPIVVTQDLLVVSGHQRVRACKEIGLLEIPCRITYYPDYDEKYNRTKDDMILEDLICTNIMQRGVGNVNPMKMAKCIQELERIKGIKVGNNQFRGSDIMSEANSTQKDLATEIGLDERQLRRYKQLNDLIPDLQQMVENGSMKATVGYKIWAKMSEEEQEKFFNDIGKEKIKTMTQKATQEYINKINSKEEENKQLKETLEKEKNKPKEKEYIETVVDNTDYTLKDKLKEKEEELKTLNKQLRLSQEEAELYKDESKEYQKMKDDMKYLTGQKNDLERQILVATDLSGLTVEIEHFLQNTLAPIKYSKSLREAKDDEVVIENIREIVNSVLSWCDEMKQYIPENKDFIEVL